jgi:hypothetical protein
VLVRLELKETVAKYWLLQLFHKSASPRPLSLKLVTMLRVCKLINWSNSSTRYHWDRPEEHFVSSKSKEKTFTVHASTKSCIYISHDYTANEGPVRIQNKCLVPIYVFPEMKLWGLFISKTELHFSVPPISTFMYL